MPATVATTIKLPEELKERIAALLEGTGQTMHSFLVEAIEAQAQAAERRRSFVDSAIAARAATLASGKGYGAGEVHEFVLARAAGKKARRPRATSWRK